MTRPAPLAPHRADRRVLGRSPSRRATTLIELVASLAIVSVLLAGVISAVTIAASAMPRNASALTTDAPADPLTRIVGELTECVDILEAGDTTISFTVPDRDADGSPERIDYAWTKSGDDLTRAFNRQAPVSVLRNVTNFALAYDARTYTEVYDPPAPPTTEQGLGSHTDDSGKSDFTVGPDGSLCLLITPALPPNATTWTATTIALELSSAGKTDNALDVYVQTIDLGTGASRLITTKSVAESAMPGGTERTTISLDAGPLGPSESLFIQFVARLSWLEAATIELSDVTPGEASRLYFGNASGSAWSYDPTKNMRFELLGTYTVRASGAQSITRTLVTRIGVEASSGASGQTIACAATPVNRPEALSAHYRTDFSTDPTTLDADADGTPDWRLETSPFDKGSLDQGLWTPTSAESLRLVADDLGPGPVTFEVRAAASATPGAVAWVTAGRDGTKGLHVRVALTLEDTDLQKLVLTTRTDQFPELVLATLPELAPVMTDIRLLIDPDALTVNLRVAGEDRGTYGLALATISKAEGPAGISAPAKGAAFDALSVRVGGRP